LENELEVTAKEKAFFEERAKALKDELNNLKKYLSSVRI
jgi:hypothetical protein